MTCGIYAIINTKNGKRYVGASITIEIRFGQHKNRLRRGVHHSIRLQRAWRKYGPDPWMFVILEEVGADFLFVAEQRWIDERAEYNASAVARGRGRGYANQHIGPSPEVRLRISEALKARYARGEWRSYGPQSEAQRRANGLRKRGNTNRLGKRHTDETKAKIRAALHGRPLSEETKAKMSATRKGRPQSPEHVAARTAARAATLRSRRQPET